MQNTNCNNFDLLIEDNEVKDWVEETGFALLGVLSGDPSAILILLNKLRKSTMFFKDRLLYINTERFVRGVQLNEGDFKKFSDALMDKGQKQENAKRLLRCLDNVDTDNKVDYIVRAARKLLVEEQRRDDFFRVCRAIELTLTEDIDFMLNNIEQEEFDYSIEVQGLLTAGLVKTTSIAWNLDSKFGFTPLAQLVCDTIVDGKHIDNVQKGTNIKLNEISEDEVKALFDKE